MALIEKESSWAAHQTGHNSGVIHSGIYYRPGSLKARLAREGSRAIIDFCEEHGLEYHLCGKVIVATDPHQIPLLDRLYRQGMENGINLRRITAEQLREIEPHARGVEAVHLPETGIVNYRQVAEKLAELLRNGGVDLRLNTQLTEIRAKSGELLLVTSQGEMTAKHMINCAGLQSDRVARLDGVRTGMRIVPFRGEYYELKPEKRDLVKGLIYPVPNPAFPFLGVHFTRMIGGHVEVGPNAVLSFHREGYRKAAFRWQDAADTLLFPGFWKLAAKYYRQGLQEMVQSWWKSAFVKNAQKLVPDIRADDLVPAVPGIRAQALHSDGRLEDDFSIHFTEHGVHVCNAPSPAATASLPIGQYIADEFARRFAGS